METLHLDDLGSTITYTYSIDPHSISDETLENLASLSIAWFLGDKSETITDYIRSHWDL